MGVQNFNFAAHCFKMKVFHAKILRFVAEIFRQDFLTNFQ